MFTKILVPVDGSGNADRAVNAAIDLARQHGSAILLLHVIRRWALPKEILDMIQAGEVTLSRLEIMQDSAEIILEAARAQCEKAGVAVASAEYISGDPAREIVNYASAHGVDLIVIGHSGLEAGEHPNLLGGVSQKLLNIASTAVLVVR